MQLICCSDAFCNWLRVLYDWRAMTPDLDLAKTNSDSSDCSVKLSDFQKELGKLFLVSVKSRNFLRLYLLFVSILILLYSRKMFFCSSVHIVSNSISHCIFLKYTVYYLKECHQVPKAPCVCISSRHSVDAFTHGHIFKNRMHCLPLPLAWRKAKYDQKQTCAPHLQLENKVSQHIASSTTPMPTASSRTSPSSILCLYSAFHDLHLESPFGDVKLKAVWSWELKHVETCKRSWWISEISPAQPGASRSKWLWISLD